ncbi:aldo/keto reductase [Helicobacter sp. T3_23-1056]
MTQQCYTLNNGVQIPKIGFGTDYIKGQACIDAVTKAIEVGYRLIDTARIYGNEKEIGIAVKKCIERGIIKRSDILIQTKCHWFNVGYEQVLDSYNQSQKELGLDIDIYALHHSYLDSFSWQSDIVSSWRAIEYLYKTNKLKIIGVCNFTFRDLVLLTGSAVIQPAFNQIEVHPQHQQSDLVKLCKSRNIFIQSWAAINKGKIFEIETIKPLCKKHNKTAGQIALAWNIKKGYAPLVRSANPKHIEENFDVFDIQLSNEDIKSLDSLNGGDFSGYDMDAIIPIGQIPVHRFFDWFGIKTPHITRYKIFGLTIAKSIQKNKLRTKYYIFGLPIIERLLSGGGMNNSSFHKYQKVA